MSVRWMRKTVGIPGCLLRKQEEQEECCEIFQNYTKRVFGRMGEDNMLQLLNLFNQMLGVMEDELKKTEKGDRIC